MLERHTRLIAFCLLTSAAFTVGSCSAAAGNGSGSSDSDSDGDTDGDTDTDTDGDTDGDTDADTDSDTDSDSDDTDTCVVSEDELDGDEPNECSETAPPESFEPDVQWIWEGEGEHSGSIVTPLVANFTEDNDDGEINLCDIPDVLVVVYNGGSIYQGGWIYLLDGADGTVHTVFPELVRERICPAIGDIDGDGLVEVVTFTYPEDNVIAFEHDGTVKFTVPTPWLGNTGPSVALADLDNDGDVEIMAGIALMDHEGNTLWQKSDSVYYYAATTAADLDGDDDLEVILGATAYHHDGTPYYSTGLGDAFPQVADLDDDPEPEILLVGAQGVTVLEHTGEIKVTGLSPSGDPAGWWNRPATIHDFDGDGVAEAAASSGTHYTVFEADGEQIWSADVLDGSGIAAGTAFDFLGDGIAEAMYADESTLFIYDGDGNVLMSTPRTSWTTTEYPIVVDVDDDGSAEIIVVSNPKEDPMSPTVQVIRDIEDRWIQARHIWNQHTYHVTNVREDGTIPQFEPPSWEYLNTFRTNSQIENGELCDPDIE